MKKLTKLISAIVLLLAVMASAVNAQQLFPIAPNSVIASGNDNDVLRDWLDDQGIAPSGTLVYRRSSNGASYSAFHTAVDDKGPTLIIFKTNTGEVFGGYTPDGWSSSYSGYRNNNNAFLFNLTSDRKATPYYPQNSIYSNSGHGPTFGGGHDIYLNNSMDGGYFNVHSYNSIDGSSYRSSTSLKALTGLNTTYTNQSFGAGFITEIEVYTIEFNASAPIIQGEDITVSLDANGQVSITPQDIDTGTTDPDGTVTLSIDIDSFTCDDLGGSGNPVEPTSIGTKNISGRSHGGGFNPNTGNFLFPNWGANAIYEVDEDGNQLSTFNSGQTYKMQLWMDQDSGTDYYSANWTSGTPYNYTRVDLNGQEIWRYTNANGNYPAGISTDAEFAYVIAYGGNRIDVLNKETGQFVSSINLGTTVYIQGSFAVVNETIYIGGSIQSGTTINNNWNVIHRYDMTGQYLGSTAVDRPTYYGWSFDGENLWINDYSSSISGYKIADGFSYGGGSNTVTLTATDPLGNSRSQIFGVTVEDHIAPTIALIGNAQMSVDSDTDENASFENLDPGATPSDNCSAEIEITGTVDLTTPGVYTLSYKAIDQSGNESATVTREVTVIDATAPEAKAGRVTVELDVNGNATVAPESLDNGSTDNGNGTLTFSLDRSTFDCQDLNAEGGNSSSALETITYVGTVNQVTQSNGGGYNPNTNEFWYPQWANSTIYVYDENHQFVRTFDSGQSSMMEVWVDTDSETDYYTANWGANTVTKRSGNSTVWSYNVGGTAGGVATDADYAYAFRHGGNIINVLDKATGAFIRNITLPGTMNSQGGLVVANNNIYIAGIANGFGTISGNWQAIHRFDIDGAYIGSTSTNGHYPWSVAFDGETMWLSPNNNVIAGFKISDGSAYGGGGGVPVTLTVTDALGNSNSAEGTVVVVDLLAPTIALNGDASIDVAQNSTFNDPGAIASDNCSATVEVTGTVDLTTQGTYTLTYKAVDGSGNESGEITRTVNVVEPFTSDITTFTDPSELQNDGLLVAATNVGANAQPVQVNGICFDNTPGTLTNLNNGGGDFCTDCTPGTLFDELFNGILYQPNGSASAITLTGLVPGNKHRLQLLMSNDHNSTGNNTTFLIQGNLVNVSGWIPNTVNATLEFIASGSTMDIGFAANNGSTANRGIISAYVLHDLDQVGALCNEPPVASSGGDITASIGAGGTATISFDGSGSSDDNGIASYEWFVNGNSVGTGTTLNTNLGIGSFSAELVITDSFGITASDQFSITVDDATDPVVIAQDITVQLDANGNASITPAQIDNGSTDNSGGTLTYALDQTDFDCDDLGANNVALNFTGGNSSFALVPYEPSLTLNSFTVEAWIRTTRNRAYDRVVSKAVGGGQNYSLAVHSGKAHIRFDRVGGGQNFAESSFNVNDGEWHHLAGVHDTDANTIKMYVDGVLVDARSTNGNPTTSSQALEVGRFSSQYDENFQGDIDEVRVWSVARTDQEVSNSFEQPLVGGEPNLLVYLDFNEGTGSIGANRGSTADAQLSNNTTWVAGPPALGVEGQVNVLLTVTDPSGNIGQGFASVTIEDNIAPTVNLNGDATITLNQNETYTETATAEDNCSATLVVTGTVDTATAGSYTLTYVATDASGNESAQVTRTVNVLDVTDPVAITRDITVSLDANGNASITPQDIDNGSSDDSGNVTLSLDQTDFDCNDLSSSVAINPTNIGVRNINTRAYGNGFNPNTNEYWFGGWADSEIYRTDIDGNAISSFNSGQSPIMQIWMNTDSETDYYTANWGNNTITKRTGSSAIWTFNLGTLASGVSVYDNKVFALRAEANIVNVLDESTGQQIATISLGLGGSTVYTQGGFAVVNDLIYIGGYARGGTTNNSSWNYIHIFDLSGNYLESVQTNYQNAYGWTFDGEALWLSDGYTSIEGIQIAEGNAYESSSVEVEVTVTDPSGNTSTATANVTVEDNIAPEITAPANISLIATSAAGATVNYTTPVGTDNCSVTTALTAGFADGDTFPIGTTVVTYTATDGSGNATSASFSVEVSGLAPDITVPANITVSTDAGVCGAVIDFAATETQGIPSASITYDIQPGSLFSVGTTTVTATATNPVGTSIKTFTVTVNDTEAPIITVNGLATVQHDAFTAYTDAGATTSDNCSATLATTDDVNVNVSGTYTVTYIATDAAGNETVTTRTVVVRDVTVPTAIAQDITVSLDANGNASITPQDIDNGSSDDSGNVTLSLDQTDFDCNDIGGGTNNYALNLNGGGEHALINASNSQMGIQATSFSVATWVYRNDSNGADQAILSNNGCLLHLTIRGNRPYLGFCGNDLAGNTVINPGQWYHIAFVYNAATSTQSIYVNGNLDASQGGHAPLNDNSPLRIGAYGGSGGLNGKIDEMSIWNSALSQTEVQSVMNDSPAGTEAGLLGFWNFEDGSGTTATDLTGRFNATFTNINNPTGAWSTDVSPANGASGGNEVTLTVTDPSGNISTATANVTVIDEIAPVITAPSDISVFATSAAGAVVNYIAPVGTDNCSVTTALTAGLVDGATFPIGTTVVTYTATDGSGNTASASFNVEVAGLAPEIIVPANITVSTDAGVCGAIVNYAATETQGIPSSSIIYDIQPGSLFSVGTTTVTATATNPVGTSMKTFTVTVNDTEAPVITINGLATVQHDAFTVYTDAGATTSDNCSATLATTDNVNMNVSGTYAVTYTSTDASGNQTVATRTVVVRDVTVPTAIAQDITVQLDANGNASITPQDIDNGSSDDSGTVTLSLDQTDFDCNDIGGGTNNYALNLNHGIETGFRTVNNANVPLGNSERTISLWVNLDQYYGGAGNLMHYGNNDCTGLMFGMGHDTNGKLIFWGGCQDWHSGLQIPLNQWAHIAMVYNGAGIITAYVNGQGQSYNIGNLNTLAGSLFLGVQTINNGASYRSSMDGQLDEAKVFNRALTSQEIMDEFSGSAPAQNNLTAYFNFEEGTGTSVEDIVGGNNGLLFGNSNPFWTSDVPPVADGSGNEITLTVTDPSGNTSTVTANVTVIDEIAPEITAPADINVFATSAAGATVNYTTPVGTDNCSVTTALTAGFADGATFPIGNTLVTYTATDGSGNTASASFNVTVTGIAPEIIVTDITVNNDAGVCGAIVNYAATETTAIPASVITYDIQPGSLFVVGTTTVTATATNAVGTSIKSFTVTVEDNEAAVVITQDITIDLDASGNASITTGMIDNGSNDACGIASYSLDKTSFDCTNVGVNTVTLTVTDNNGNVSSNTAQVTVRDVIAAVVITQDITIDLDASGNASITTGMIDNGSNDACGIASFSLDKTTFDCTNVGANTVTLTVTDNNGNVSSNTATVTVRDVIAAVVITQDITIDLDANGNASITTGMIDNGSNDACGIASFSLDKTAFDCTNVGANTVTLTVTDNNGNVSTNTATVTVRDVIAAVVITQDITIDLDASGNASITTGMIDNGSNDACGIASYSLDKTTFDCTNVGANTVTLTVTDNNGNVSTNTATVTVRDVIAAVVITQDITIDLDASGNASITTGMIDNGSNDACGIASYSLDKTSFDCTNVGANTVTLTVTDNNGNVSSNTAQVTVRDVIAAVVITQDITIDLDASGNASITTGMIDNGSNDACGIASFSLDKTSFDCTNVGANTVILTVTDNNGNVSSNTAQVTVRDVIAAVVITQDITIDLDASGNASITTGMIDNGSNDACGIVSFSLDKTSFDCTNVGANTVTLTVTDNNGNVSANTAQVTVRDVIAAVVITQDITIDLDASGNASITTGMIDNGSNDACGIASYSLDKTAFDCTNVGTNTVTLTVTDNNGNVSANAATVTVRDVIAPNAITRDITVQLDVNGNASITPLDINDGSNDNCGPVTLAFASSGVINATVNEGYNLVLQAPEGAVIDGITFASYGTPNGSAGNYTLGSCHATNSVSIIESYALGQNYVVIPATNTVFGDPCGGTYKRLYVTATYSASGGGQLTDFDCSNVGDNIVTLLVTDANGNESTATANVTVEDNIAAVVITQDITIDLDANGNSSITTGMIDNGSNDACGVASYSLDKTTFDCTNVGANTVTLTVTDNNGNVSSNTAQVTVRDVIAAVVITQDITIDLGANGNASITTGMIDNGSNDACGIASYSLDKTTFDCTNVGANTVTLTVTDNNGNVSSNTAQVTVRDVIAAVVITQDITIDLDASGNASITTGMIDNGSNDACGIASFSLDKTTFDCTNVGANTVTLTVTDNNGNVSTNTATVTVRDVIAAVVITQDITIDLDASGNASITTGMIDNGSNDACGIASYSLDKTSFDCTNVGANTVTLTVTDNNGNVSANTATVTVRDVIAAVVITQDITIDLDASGNASITTGMIDNGSNDACGIASYSLDKTSFDCTNVGTNTVTLTVTDNNGNVSSNTAQVTVRDVIAAVVITQDITIDLDASGNASITTGMIDNGSNDACGIASYSLDKTSFDCTNVGTNTVTLTVTDNNGNVSANTATVTVRDVIAPTVITQNIEVFLDENGAASITPNSVNDGTYDNCTFELSIDIASFTCDNVGTNTVTLTAVDASGNTTSATAIVTVSDVILPTVVPTNINVYLDTNGNTSITVGDVNGGTFDNCGIATITIDINSFDCADLGTNNVTLTATDVNGNVNTGVAVVTVIDDIAPIVGVQNITVSLDENGVGSIVPADVLLFTEEDVIRDTECDLTASTDKYVMKVKEEYYKKGHKNTKGKGHSKDKGKGHENDDENDDYDNDKYDQYYFSGGKLLRRLDGSLLLTGTLTDDDQATDSYAVSITLVGSYDYATWRSMDGKVKEQKYTDNHLDWTYYSVQGGMLTGTGDNVGDNYPITAYKSEEGFQLGMGANGESLGEGLRGKFLSEIGKGDLSLDISDCELLPIPAGTTYTSDNCGIVSYSFDQDTFSCNDYSETVVNLTATDQSGNTTTVAVTVTIVDNIAPTAVALDYITVSLGADGTVTIDPSQVDGGSFDNTDCITLSLDMDTFSCDDIGKGNSFYVYDEEESCKYHKHTHGKGHNYDDDDDSNDPGKGKAYGHKKSKKTKLKGHRVTLTVTDAAGNSDQVETYIVIVDDLGPVIAEGPVTIVVYDETSGSGKKSKTKQNTEYVKDEDIEPLVSDNCEVYKIDFPKTKYSSDDAGMNQLEVTAKDKSGNVSVGMVNVEVIDITALGKYIEMCYKGQSVMIKNSSVQDYLRKGASLGSCGAGLNTQNKVLPFGETEAFIAELNIVSYPNPTTGFTTISISSNVEGPARVGLVSTAGVEITEIYAGELQANEKFEVGFDGSNLPSGVYIVRLVTAGQVKNLKLMIKK